MFIRTPHTNPIDYRNINYNFFRDSLTPYFGPFHYMNVDEIDPLEAYEIVNSETYFDPNPQLNLATFVTTWMEPTAIEIMKNTLDVNFIDKSIYLQSSEIEKRCISILSKLYHASKDDKPFGTSTIGSTEAALLAGLNYKFKWKKYFKNKDIGNPEIVLGSNVQVCWLKFAKYFEVTPVIVPVNSQNRIDPEEVSKKLNDKTICVVGILGNTFSGEYDDINALNTIVDNYNKTHEWQIPIHVDAASGGFVAPFYNRHKDILWDFRLKWVKSINVSGHKYGFVYPGIGWAIWRNEEDLDKELIFKINYIGGTQTDFSLNFSKNASNIVAQYYNFTRLGEKGYERVITYLFNLYYTLQERFNRLKINNTKIFNIIDNPPTIPIVILSLTDDSKNLGLDLTNLAMKMKEYGWSIPVYPLPSPFENTIVMRMVLRISFNHNIANKLYNDIVESINYILSSNVKSFNDIPLEKGYWGIC